MIKYDIKKTDGTTFLIPKDLKKMNVTKELDEIVSKIKERVEREIPDKGYFRNFAEDFKNKDDNMFARAFSLSVQRDETEEGKALLLANVLHPSMNIEASVMLRCGDRKELLEYMSKDSFKDEVIQSFTELSESLKKR